MCSLTGIWEHADEANLDRGVSDYSAREVEKTDN